MNIELPCKRTEQLSLPLFPDNKPIVYKHRFKNHHCVYCGLHKASIVVSVCDCGCNTVLDDTALTIKYLGRVFIFGHETRDLFSDSESPGILVS